MEEKVNTKNKQETGAYILDVWKPTMMTHENFSFFFFLLLLKSKKFFENNQCSNKSAFESWVGWQGKCESCLLF